MISQTLDSLGTVPDPANHTPEEFADHASTFTQNLVVLREQINTLISQWNAGISELNNLGAVSVSYNFSTTTTDSDPGAGNLRLNSATQNAATTLRLDLVDRVGATVTTLLDSFDDSTSTVKGTLRITAEDDPTRYLVFLVTAVASPSGYRNVTVSCVAYSSTNPFVNGEAVTVSYIRNGDLGEAGEDAEFTSPTRTIAADGNITSADNGYLLDVTASGVDLTLDSPAALGAGFSCMTLESQYGSTLAGTFNDGATSKKLMPRGAYYITSDGSTHRVTRVGGAAAIGQCVFKYVSATQCRLDPCNGDRIVVGGKEMQVPAAGVTVSNGGLAVSTLYYAYAYDNAGALTLEFSTTAPTDAASGLDAWGNRNKTGDTSRTLVGAVYTNASALFSYDKANRLVRSWFNDEGVTAEGIYASNVNFGSGPWTELHVSFRALVLMWAGEQFKADGSAVCHDAGGGAGSMYGSIGLNGSPVGRQGIVTTAGNQVYRTCGFGHASSVASDGANTFTLMGGIASGGTPQYLGGYCSYTVNTSRKH